MAGMTFGEMTKDKLASPAPARYQNPSSQLPYSAPASLSSRQFPRRNIRVSPLGSPTDRQDADYTSRKYLFYCELFLVVDIVTHLSFIRPSNALFTATTWPAFIAGA